MRLGFLPAAQAQVGWSDFRRLAIDQAKLWLMGFAMTFLPDSR